MVERSKKRNRKIMKQTAVEWLFEQISSSKYYYKIIISGTPEELKTIKLGPFLEILPKSKIVYKTISSTINKWNHELDFDSKSFLELLYEEIESTENLEEQQELNEIYCQLFGMNKIAESRFVIVE